MKMVFDKKQSGSLGQKRENDRNNNNYLFNYIFASFLIFVF